ncbi:MAG: excinuclease ABC subunit UvrA [Verrucomicrobiales bacterium]
MNQLKSIDQITIRGARQHNLKNINVNIPRHRFVVITGTSGSGKSSLAFNTIYAEGQRKYVESLSSYARQFLDQLEKPDVDSIEGLSPALAIEQRSSSPNPRSTVATSTEIYDYLRVLYSSIGIPHDPNTGEVIEKLTIDNIVEKLLALEDGSKVIVLSPILHDKGSDIKNIIERLKRNGFIRARINNEFIQLDEALKPFQKNIKYKIQAVVDRIVIKDGLRSRLYSSVETAIKWGALKVDVMHQGKGESTWVEDKFSTIYTNPKTGFSLPEITPKHFSFNSHYGACEMCHGVGSILQVEESLFIKDENLSLNDGAIHSWWNRNKKLKTIHDKQLEKLANEFNVSTKEKFSDLGDNFIKMIFFGIPEEKKSDSSIKFEGLINQAERLYSTSKSESTKRNIRRFMLPKNCPNCNGARLKKSMRSITIEHEVFGELSIDKFTKLSVTDALRFIKEISINNSNRLICKDVLSELSKRLKFLVDVGLSYLNLNRESSSLSGGESQRIRLATQMGSGLSGVLYVLDEPSAGLHQSDNALLIKAFQNLRDLGNTVIVVEHDAETIMSSDYVIDIGPGAGPRGGNLIAEGTPREITESPKSITGKYLSGELKINPPKNRIAPPKKTDISDSFDSGWISVVGASENNLKNIEASFPIGCLTCVTGISGSGKSTLVHQVLKKAIFRKLYRSKDKPGKHDKILGLNQIDKAILIDQSPIGKSPRSNPVTFSGAFTEIRKLYSQVQTSKIRGYGIGRFSFNVKGGRCEACSGDGFIKIDMHFLSDVYVKCESCNGSRYNRETLDVTYKGKNISEVLEMSVDEATQFFSKIPKIYTSLRAMGEVGLGYVKLGQPANTLSGGEAQRLKLATELAKTSTGDTLYLLDEPTTGLHFSDINNLLSVLFRLRDNGNSLIIIEHNLDVIKCADWIIDMGPKGGPEGGYIVAEGCPDIIINQKNSMTGKFLKSLL